MEHERKLQWWEHRQQRDTRRKEVKARYYRDLNENNKKALEIGKAYVDSLVQRMPKIYDKIIHYRNNPEYREITVTIKPSCKLLGKLYYADPLDQYNKIVEVLTEQKQFKYIICGEFHKNGNVHIHGAVMHPSGYDIHYARLRRKLARLIGRTSITEIKDKEKWLNYMFKEQHKSGLEIHTIGYTNMDMKYLPNYNKRWDVVPAEAIA